MTAPYNLQYQGIAHIFHTVGPTRPIEAALAGCYRTLLECCLTYGARTIAIPCVATGIFGFPKHQACNIALGTVRILTENRLYFGIFWGYFGISGHIWG